MTRIQQWRHWEKKVKRKIRVPGEKTKLLCENCGDLRSATWNYGDFEFKNGTVVSGVMLAFCDECLEQAGLAAQSSYLLREANITQPSKPDKPRVAQIELALDRLRQ